LGIVSDQDTDAQGQPKKMASKKDPNEKEKLNHKQFIRAMAEIQSGKYTKEFILNAFDLTEEQILTIDEMNV
jgi:Ca2+-binding EF-hand superfamily protein